jgi:Zn-dependent protease with chaperone function
LRAGVQGQLYGMSGSRSVRAWLDREGATLRWCDEAGQVLATAPLDACEFSDAPGGAAAFVTLPDGQRFETREGSALLALGAGAVGFRHSWLSRLEGHGGAVLLAVLVTALLLYAGIRFAVPAIASEVAEAVPPSVAQGMDRAVLRGFDEGVLTPSRLAPADRERVEALLAPLIPGVPSHVRPALAFRDGGEVVGANAFALPGGQIVVTDAIVELLPDAELQAVLAHELSHGAARHSLRRGLQFSGLAVLWSWVTGDLGALLTLLPVTLLELSYARDFEFEADAQAVERLAAIGQDPKALARALGRLSPEGAEIGSSGYLSTHPPTVERLEALAAAVERVRAQKGSL